MQRTKRMGALVLAGGLLVVAGLSLPGTAWADTEVQASNSCEDCKTETGDAQSSNSSSTYTGQHAAGDGASNHQEGDNTTKGSQESNAQSGTGVNGQVIGAVDSGDGDVKIIASNHVKDSKVSTGNAFATNTLVGFVGQSAFGAGASNHQVGDNTAKHSQLSDAGSGDGINGQVIGVVSS